MALRQTVLAEPLDLTIVKKIKSGFTLMTKSILYAVPGEKWVSHRGAMTLLWCDPVGQNQRGIGVEARVEHRALF
jgi:hypothetical protein